MIDPDMGGLPVPLGVAGDGRGDYRGAEMVAGVVLDDQDRTIAALLRTDNRREIGAIDIAALDLARFSLQVHVLLLYFM